FGIGTEHRIVTIAALKDGGDGAIDQDVEVGLTCSEEAIAAAAIGSASSSEGIALRCCHVRICAGAGLAGCVAGSPTGGGDGAGGGIETECRTRRAAAAARGGDSGSADVEDRPPAGGRVA